MILQAAKHTATGPISQRPAVQLPLLQPRPSSSGVSVFKCRILPSQQCLSRVKTLDLTAPGTPGRSSVIAWQDSHWW